MAAATTRPATTTYGTAFEETRALNKMTLSVTQRSSAEWQPPRKAWFLLFPPCLGVAPARAKESVALSRVFQRHSAVSHCGSAFRLASAARTLRACFPRSARDSQLSDLTCFTHLPDRCNFRSCR